MSEYKFADKEHRLVLVNQEQLELTGITRVESFNPEEIVMETQLGLIAVRGEELDIRNLNLEEGTVEIDGLVLEILYTGERSAGGKRGLLARLFK